MKRNILKGLNINRFTNKDLMELGKDSDERDTEALFFLMFILVLVITAFMYSSELWRGVLALSHFL